MSTTRSNSGSLLPSYFDAKYREDIDPWQFRTSAYERDKFKATLDAFARPHYQSVLEVGCAIGVLSALIATRCDRLVALDGSSTAIDEASRMQLPNVRFSTAFLPDEFPDGMFDLIVLSEVLYYFSEQDLNTLADKCLSSLQPTGEIILCHWLGQTDYPLKGRQASDLFAQALATRRPGRTILHDGIYRLERLTFATSDADGAK
jgi:cyclopropane fatty-acyl-phospholipid synthase-like methyltransferase